MGQSNLKSKPRITDKQALAAVEQLVARIRRAATRLPDGIEERQERLTRARRDFWFFAQTYLPHHFSADPAAMHFDLIGCLQDPGISIIRMPRAFAKTTCAQGFILWQMLFGRKHFAIAIGKSADMGREFLETMILELEENERIHQDFGEQRTAWWSHQSGFRLKSSGAWLLSKGRGEPVRGEKRGQHRPDLLIADDIEDEELARSPKRIRQLLKWWLQSVVPMLGPGGTACWLCTSLAAKSPSALLLDPEWKYSDTEEPPCCRRRSFPAENVDGESTWPAVWPKVRLQAERAKIGSTAYRQEYLHLPEMAGGMFRDEWLQNYDESQLPAGLVTVLACDPAVKKKETACFKAIVVLSKDPATEIHYVRHAWLRRDSTNAMVTMLFDLDQLYHPTLWVVEMQGFAQLLRELIAIEGRKRGRKPPLRPIEQNLGKELRIRKLEPLAENGQLRFRRHHSDQDELIEEFAYFPSAGKPDDGPDAVEMGIQILAPFRAKRQAAKYERVSRRMNMAEAL
jgi:predicted phage terminase large subunit-like protein